MNEDAKELLSRYFAGNVTEEEGLLVEYWFHHLNDENEPDISQQDLQAVSKEMWHTIAPVRKFSIVNLQWLKVAAAAMVMLTVGAAWFFVSRSRLQKVSQPQISFSHPGGNKAFLKMDNGKVVVLDDSAKGKVAWDDKALVTQIQKGHIKDEPDLAAGEGFHTLSTPAGGQYAITLSDGTCVYLNAASSLRYPTRFGTGPRIVELSGEAYFEVKHDEQHPFKVISGSQVTDDIGTAFNVKAYPDDNKIVTSLSEGAVRIRGVDHSLFLNPGQQAILSGKTLGLAEGRVADAIAWKEGYFKFRQERLEDIMKSLSRWYDIDVEYLDYNKDELFNGQVSRYKDIREILDMLEHTDLVHFKVKGRRILVTR
ncbi:DUF4974 domain-containing protein [Mucilaginibacter conchicola]|uniref:DUF4974 domain-containing protein n=1 Tax=Mucilaginibacter conchicola TaxID=2303333 RepID=A0A372NQH3_9SPHI|nr:FecR domain-containing protein [Mucilaginibacter conchicola]RFZ91184.1 DUF4974 domain-containing protein [Mucilaginibacter conchicola]